MVRYWSWYLFGEQIAIKASNENTKEIETINSRSKPIYLVTTTIIFKKI